MGHYIEYQKAAASPKYKIEKVGEAYRKNQHQLELVQCESIINGGPRESHEFARIIFLLLYICVSCNLYSYNTLRIKQKMSLIPILSGQRRSNNCHPFPMGIWAPIYVFPSSNTLNKTRGSASKEVSAFACARIDCQETPEALVFRVDLPGFKKEEVKVEVEEGGVLKISGERNREQEEKNDKWHCEERSSGKFLRRFRLPEGGKVEEIKAAMENGVLTVTVPKEEVKKPQSKTIDIS